MSEKSFFIESGGECYYLVNATIPNENSNTFELIVNKLKN